jgi:MinD-like ATPase involved in chromosome partitioning or flagellar assembly
MSERPSSEFDDHAPPPQPPAADGSEPGSGPPPPWLRGEQAPAAPGSDRTPWGGAPPQQRPATSPGAGDRPPAPAPGTPAERERTGPHRVARPSADEATAIVDPAITSAARHDRPTPAPGPELGGLTEPHGEHQPRSGGQFEAPTRGGRLDPAAQRGTGTRPGGPAAPGSAGRAGPSWTPPPAQQAPPGEAQQAPPGEWPQEQGWSQAQGSAANWSYVDNIRRSELVPTRRIPPARGWRKALYLGTFKLINPGQSPDERYQAELETKIRSLLRGTYKIGVLGKGGVGKSTIAASVGSVFAELRQDDRVVAIDADTAFGKLASRIDPSASGSYWELAGDRGLHSFADMRSRVGSNSAGLFVLPGEATTARRRVLDPAVYRAATAQLDRHFTLSIVDCGSTMDSPVTREVLNDVDALIVVTSPWYDGSSAAAQTLEWLANGGFTALLHRTVVVINDSDGHAPKRETELLVERFGKFGQKVITMPYDRLLRPGGVIDVANDVSPHTRRRLLELAAECAEHFAATADRPGGRR